MAENNEVAKTDNGTISIKGMKPVDVLRNPSITKLIEKRIGKNAGQIVTSALAIVNDNKLLQNVNDPMTVVNAVITAGNLDLPLNKNLGFAYIVPYKGEAQFQMGWKGFVQLAQRSGKFQTINTTDVRSGEVKSRDRMTGKVEFEWIEDDEEREKQKVVGYMAYFELLNGFSKSLYMTKAQVEAHAGKFSQAYKSGGQTPWKSDFDAMAQKTVLKQLLSKYAPLSTEMQEAVVADQSVAGENGIKYADNPNVVEGELADDDAQAAILDANTDKSTGEIKEPKK